MRDAIERLTGRSVREAAAEIEPATGAVIHAFSSGSMMQLFLLAPDGRVISAQPTESTDPNQQAQVDEPRGGAYPS